MIRVAESRSLFALRSAQNTSQFLCRQKKLPQTCLAQLRTHSNARMDPASQSVQSGYYVRIKTNTSASMEGVLRIARSVQTKTTDARITCLTFVSSRDIASKMPQSALPEFKPTSALMRHAQHRTGNSMLGAQGATVRGSLALKQWSKHAPCIWITWQSVQTIATQTTR